MTVWLSVKKKKTGYEIKRVSNNALLVAIVQVKVIPIHNVSSSWGHN